jgi:hypothetical protein
MTHPNAKSMHESPGRVRLARYRWVGVVLLLALLLLQMATSSAHKSAAFDETYHLVSGYAYLRTGDPRLSWEHPPVAQVLAALPLIGRDDMAPFPFDRPAWQAGDGEAFVDDYLWVDNALHAADLVWAGRWPLMLLTLLFGAALFFAICRTAGEPAAWLGLTLFVLDPNIVASGRLIGNDLAMAGFLFIAVWRLGVYLERPDWKNLLLTGLAAGLALASKSSAAIVAPIFLLVVLIHLPRDGHSLSIPRRLLALVAMAGVACVVVWAAFGFEVGPIGEGGLPLPAPTFIRGLPGVWQRVARGTPTFLFGRISDTGWWYYFPLVFLLKTPVSTLVLLGCGLFVAARRWREQALWWGPWVLYFVVASSSTLQIGYRYILPVLFFALPLAAEGAVSLLRRRTTRVFLALLLVWGAVDALHIYPDHLSYVNALGGGPNNGWRIFADMNVDWGQDLVALEEYTATNPAEDLRLSYFGSAYPSVYGVDARILPSFSRLLAGPDVAGFNPYTPEPGTYALSATSLQLGMIYWGQDLYAFFRDLTPDALIGRSILVYQVDYSADVPVERAVVVGPDVSSIAPDALGLEDGHRLVTKWSGAGGIVLAGGGPARYVVEAPVPDSPLVADVLAAGPVVDARPHLEQIPVDAAPTSPTGEEIHLPASFSEGPALAGWTLSTDRIAPGGSFGLITYWLVEEPLDPPLAIFVHLLGGDGLPMTQWDGWPVSTLGLEAGDVIVLSHPLHLPADVAPGSYTLQLGIYRPPHGPRLQVAGANRVILAQVDVQQP